MKGWYDRYILPPLLHMAMKDKSFERQRKKVIPGVVGRVLEVGLGTGLNLAFYDADKVELLVGLEPSEPLRTRALDAARGLDFDFELLDGCAESIPCDDAAFDTVVSTYTLCSVIDPALALAEIRRVLKPGGRLVFSEHGLAPSSGLQRCQRWLNPVWRRLAGGCNLDRPIDTLLIEAGLEFDSLETMFLPGFKPLTYNFWGSARER
jgi:ubiquinone/menaquinone biosynthesis C-methylase UbiE